jgi:dTDP-4-dehydrorhamnose reductase
MVNNTNSNNKYIVLGASGLVGNAIFRLLDSKESMGFDIEPIEDSIKELDILNYNSLQKLILDLKPKVIFWAPARTNVEEIETNPGNSWQVNVESVKNLSQIIKDSGISTKLVFFSSDYIFNGNNGPYSEKDLPDPLNVYGRQKLNAEQEIIQRLDNFIIIRTTIIYGLEARKKNFLYQVIKKLNNRQRSPVAADQLGSPTLLDDLAANCIKLAEGNFQGVINVAGDNVVSRYEFAMEIAKQFGLDSSFLVPVKTKELLQKAKRPLNAGLNIDLLKSLNLGVPMRDFRKGLEFIRENYYEEFSNN